MGGDVAHPDSLGRWSVSPVTAKGAASNGAVSSGKNSGAPRPERAPESNGLLALPISDAQRQNHRTHCVFAGIIAWLGSVAVAGVVTGVFIALVRLVGAILGFSQGSAFWPMLVLGVASTLAVSVFWNGYVQRSLGIRRIDRLPAKVKKILEMPSMEGELKMLRVAVIVSASLPCLVSLLSSLGPLLSTGLPEMGRAAAFSFGWVAMMLSGLTIWICGVSTFREVRAKFLRNSLRFHHRGVALRSFISEWDSPGREIYQSCRLSRRISRAHSAVFLTTIACFSLAGCLAGFVESSAHLGELMGLVSLAAILVMWPTPSRLVAWCGQVLDKFCGDREEYDIY